MRIVFLHPDLGLGGAERLIVDAAIAMKRKVLFFASIRFETIENDDFFKF